ncbi:hypothetical protein H2198_007744 [Neophaeococcomyces mojaviensis]|uniref:Uncharacterized protein n=1 Tax=Neophaeococcomyces mojaviensis TaxID=3383035 RepID=A0ACC2ZZM6_9EURO|nr:hypothetical protein H2198_007744 [Knufia sp. JES_112]
MEVKSQAQNVPRDSPKVENWDDDDDFDNFEDIHFRTASTATSVVSHAQTNHRESTSSRMSLRSDSNQGDEHWDVLVDEQSSVKDALSIAKSKGIPLPSNLPRSALEGGTIRRLGGKAVKRAIADDWSEDLDFSNAPSQLRIAKREERNLSESLRQISAAFRSSPKSPEEKDFSDPFKSPKSRLAPTPVSLEDFREGDNDDFGDVPTIRVAKHRSPQKIQLFSPPAPRSSQPEIENIEEDLEIPSDGKLRLSTKKLSPRTPLNGDDFDAEWAEGSLGTRHAGTRRGGMSNRSSSISALSPSVSSAFTVESEEDGLEGLILPQGPVNFNNILKIKQDAEKENHVPRPTLSPQAKRPQTQLPIEDDWGEDLVIPNGKVFDGARLTLNRNIKQKTQRSTSPGKIKATTLNFTSNKPSTAISRVPRIPFHERQERPRSHLEPVSETGAPIQRYQRPNSRLGHAASSSVSSIPAPATPTPSTPSRRDLRNTARNEMRYQPATTTNAQLLRAKRSIPAMSSINSPTRMTFNRPPSRQDGTSSRLRPRSPERPESRLGPEKKNSAPFLPAGASTAQSQHISMKSAWTRGPKRADSDGSGESMTAAQKSLSRLAGIRPQTPGKGRSDYSAAELAAQAKKTMNKPLRRRNWGDGSELEVFDDLPTSALAEAKFTKQPIGRGAPRSLRSKLGQPAAASSTSLVSARSGAETPVQPPTPMSPPKSQDLPMHFYHSNVPRFARDTAASRIAREQRSISSTFHNMRGEPLQPVSTNTKAIITSKPTYGGSLRRKKSVQQKPHLIKPIGGDVNRAKEEKGMYYNPVLCRWEGNDTALAPFDVPDFLPRQPSPGEGVGLHPHIKAGSATKLDSPAANSSKPNLALIMNVGGTSGVQLVNGMVFDPRQMKWLKVAPNERGDSIRSGNGSVQLEEEEDVFAGLEDLKEESENMSSVHESKRDRSVSGIGVGDKTDHFNETTSNKRALGDDDHDNTQMSGHNSSSDEWGPGVAEEYDVGPEFVRRQRMEEDRWRRKVEKWMRSDDEVAAEEVEGLGGWRWAIREFVGVSGLVDEQML